MPRPDISLSGFGKELWCKKLDYQITLFPGVHRDIMDECDNCYGLYIWYGYDSICLQVDRQQINQNYFTDLGWCFHCNSEEVARIIYIPEEECKSGCEKGFDTESMYCV